MQNLKQRDVVYAGFFIRLAAYLIDMVIVTVLLAVLRFPVWILRLSNPDLLLTRAVIFRFSIWDVILYLLGVAYFILTTYKTGTTIGKRLMGIKVISAEGKIRFLDVCYRETIGRYLSSVVIYAGYILIGVDAEKRGIHDMLCDTRVVYADMAPIYVQPKNNGFPGFSTASPTGTSMQIPSQTLSQSMFKSPNGEENGGESVDERKQSEEDRLNE